MDSPAAIFEIIDAALKMYSAADTLEGNPLSAPETFPAALSSTEGLLDNDYKEDPSFHLLDGVTRHLKRCHSKRVTFSCALCSLPFETQKQCKMHQVTCRKRLKGTPQSPALAPSPPAARRPAAPEPQQRKVTLQAAVKKPAPVARPAERDAAIEKVPAASGNITQVLASRRPVSPSHVTKQISILRHLSATLPPVQHVPVPRRISSPLRIAAGDPVAGRASAAPQSALRNPTAGGASTAPQTAPRAPDVAGGTSPTDTPKHWAFIARRPSTAPTSILQDIAYGRSHAAAATAQAAATHRRTSGVLATLKPDRVSPTTSNASILPEIPPQHPTEGNPDPRDRRQADHAGFEPAPDEVEDHEGQAPMVRAATLWQTAWTKELQVASSFDDFDLLVDRLTQELSAEIVPRRSSNQENALRAHRKPASNHNTTTREARS
ncbi:unnamed protein product [Caretta caretta]